MNAFVLAAALWSAAAAPRSFVELPVPVLEQRPERCGPTALAMVLSYYGADSASLAISESAYDPALRGALLTDLASCARRAGFRARVASLEEDSLRTLLAAGVPPVLLYERGLGPLTRRHYGVLVGWDERRGRLVLNDGGPRRRSVGRAAFVRSWRAAGGQALIVERP